jgi:DNA replication protein DnaC
MTTPEPLENILNALAAVEHGAIPEHAPKCNECNAAPVPRFGKMCAPCIERRDAREKREMLVRAFLSIPTSLRRVSFDDREFLKSFVDDVDAIAAARDSVTRKIVTLCGPARAGKTTLAVCMLRERIVSASKPTATLAAFREAAGARFVVAADLVQAQSEHPFGKGSAPLVKAARAATVLVLDEVGGGPQGDVQGVVFRLLHERHRELKQTIVTTGLDEHSVSNLFGGGIAGRLFEDAFVIRVNKRAGAGQAA